ncbi:MAG: hypothetical protein HY235_16435 [Acidobacteria bacterium]|nr:hypothetical protein [Acidobacteriota bacterium]
MRTPTVALVGGESLLGREIREVLRGSSIVADVRLIGADQEETGRITEEAGEPVVITSLDQANLASADVVVLAGSAASSRKAWELILDRRDTHVVDATGALEDLPSARLRAPLVELDSAEPCRPAVLAHPAAVALTLFYNRIAGRHSIRHSLVEIFEPASERGQQGIDELHQQTVKLFSFQGLPKDVYDAQLAYNLLASFGEESPHNLEQIELGIERHLASLLSLGGRTPMPSLRLIQAPVFHGYSFSVWVEFESEASAGALAETLASDLVQVETGAGGAPNNVAAAGEHGIAAGNIRADRNHARAVWFWIVADNLRLTAENTVRWIEQA